MKSTRQYELTSLEIIERDGTAHVILRITTTPAELQQLRDSLDQLSVSSTGLQACLVARDLATESFRALVGDGAQLAKVVQAELRRLRHARK